MMILYNLILSIVVLLCGCSEKREPIIGNRESVLPLMPSIKADMDLKSTVIELPPLNENKQCSHCNSVGHFKIGSLNALKLQWSTSIGQGSNRTTRILSSPVSDGELIFTIDADGLVSAVELDSGNLIWQIKSNISGKKTFSGGISYQNGFYSLPLLMQKC